MVDPRRNDPGRPDPLDPADPLAPENQALGMHDPASAVPPAPARDRFTLIAAGVIAVLLVIGIVAFTSGPGTDAETTATIPPAGQEEIVPGAAPADPALEPAAPAQEVDPAPAAEPPLD